MSEPVDPDLSAALEELADAVRRLAGIEEQLSLAGAQSVGWRHAQLVDARTNILDRIANRAKVLNMKPGSLRLAVELANRHRDRTRRKISLGQLRRDLDVALNVLRANRQEADAVLIIAQHRAAAAARGVDDADAAVDYLEASRP